MALSTYHLEVNNVAIAYRSPRAQQKRVVSDVNFSLVPGEIACLLGPSGCGKTTLLRAIAGFEPIVTGSIVLHGQQVSSPQHTLPPEQRRVGIVFQDYALFPHLSVEKNIAFGIERMDKSQRTQRVNELLALVDLNSIKEKYPHEISGGQQQRVALARALAPRPELLLLDEPFSSLDSELRERLSLELRDILKREQVTALMVTHDQHEAFAMADKIGVMDQGHIIQWDSAYQLYHHPTNTFIANFIGSGQLVCATCLSQLLPEPLRDNTQYLIRHHAIVVDPASSTKRTLVKKHFKGPGYVGVIRLDDAHEVELELPNHARYEVGDELGIRLLKEHIQTL